MNRSDFVSQATRIVMPKLIIIFLLSFSLISCAYNRIIPYTEGPDSSAIGVTINLKGSFISRSGTASGVYFIKLDDVKEASLFNQQKVIQSNYVNGKYVYLLNAKPGRYAIVAAYVDGTTPGLMVPTGSGQNTSFTTTSGTKYRQNIYFSKDIIKITEMEVPRGQMVFMGKYKINKTKWFKELDQVQYHYQSVINPTKYFNHYPYKGSLLTSNKGKHKEEEFLRTTEKIETLKLGGWTDRVTKRLAILTPEM